MMLIDHSALISIVTLTMLIFIGINISQLDIDVERIEWSSDNAMGTITLAFKIDAGVINIKFHIIDVDYHTFWVVSL